MNEQMNLNVGRVWRVVGLWIMAFAVAVACLMVLGPGPGTLLASEDVEARVASLPSSTVQLNTGLTSVCPAGIACRQRNSLSTAEFTYAQLAGPTSLDPAATTDGESLQVTAQLYETLVTYEEGGTIVLPGLSDSWTISADGLTWTFYLRSGITFHDGSDLDAAAVAYNFERWWDPSHPYHDADFVYFQYLFGGFKGDPGCLLLDVSTSGTDQVLFTLSEPHSSFPSILAWEAFAIASPAAIQGGDLANHPVGTGPFTFVEWLPGEHVRLAANPGYWGDPPLLDAVVFVPIAESAARLAALQANLVQGTTLSASDVLIAGQDPDLKVAWRPSLMVGYLGINHGRPPLDVPLVDQAIAHAIDRASILNDYFSAAEGYAEIADQLVPPVVWGHKEDLADYSYDPVLARSLLEQAGYPNGFSTTIWLRNVVRGYLPDPVGVAGAMQADLAEVGISATVVVTDSAAFLNAVYAGETDLFLLGWFADYPHPENFLSPIVCGMDLAFGPRDDVLCDQLDAARAIFDFDTLKGIYEWANQRVHDTLPVLPTGYGQSALVLRRNVTGLTPSPFGTELLDGVFFSEGGADAWGEVSPEEGGTLEYTDTQGGSAHVEVPSGAVAETVTLVYTYLAGPTEPHDLAFAGHAFGLEAYLDGQLLPELSFSEPVSVSIHYPQADVVCLDEVTLELRYWDGTTWANDGIALVERDTANNRLLVTVSHLSEFATFAQERDCVRFPLVQRSY